MPKKLQDRYVRNIIGYTFLRHITWKPNVVFDNVYRRIHTNALTRSIMIHHPYHLYKNGDSNKLNVLNNRATYRLRKSNKDKTWKISNFKEYIMNPRQNKRKKKQSNNKWLILSCSLHKKHIEHKTNFFLNPIINRKPFMKNLPKY